MGWFPCAAAVLGSPNAQGKPAQHIHLPLGGRAARQASLSITNSQSLLKLMSIRWVMPSNHLILCHPLLLLPSILPSIRVFSSESVFHIKWAEYWSFSFSISPSNEYSGLIPLGLTSLISLLSKGLLRVLFNTIVQKHHSSMFSFLYRVYHPSLSPSVNFFQRNSSLFPL